MNRAKSFGIGISAAILAAVSFAAVSARADLGAIYYNRAAQRAWAARNRELLDYTLNQTASGTFDQRIDHADAQDMRTFKQRYWLNSTYAKGPDSPVLFYICGEATCSAEEMEGAALENAQKLGAYVVALEHRYYGLSQPFPALTTQSMKYLTVAEALEDLAAFESWAKSGFGLTGKWISIGGSYPGSLSAYYRTLYPQMVVGALASSAPVMAKDNFEDYDRHVTEVAGAQCAAVMRLVVKAADDAVAASEASPSDPSKLDSIKAEFAAQKITDDDDFLYVIADVGASAVQYGMRDEFCNALISAAGPGGTDTEAATQAYGRFAQRVYAMWGVDAYGFSAESAQSTNPNDYVAGVGQRQWMYQSCTEYGYFQNAYHDPAYSVRSPRINPAYHRGLCKRLFGQDLVPDIAAMNAEYYQPVLERGSNILMTNGSNDPWSLLGITAANGNDTNPDLTVMLIEGGAHCDDLLPSSASDSASLLAARREFSSLTTTWLTQGPMEMLGLR